MKKNITHIALTLLFVLSSWDSVAEAAAYPPDVKYTEVSVPSISRPALLSSITTPFGTQMMRFSDGVGHMYSKRPTWNSDQTLLFMSGSKLYDAKTYKYIKNLPVNSEAVWSSIDPNKMFNWSGNSYYSVNVQTGASTLLHTFSGYSSILLGPSEANMSIDDRMIAIIGDKKDIIVYDFKDDKIVTIKSLASLGYSWSDIDWVSVSQSGKYVVISSKSGMHIVKSFDQRLNYVATLFTWLQHGDLGYDTSGNEVFVQNGVRGGPATMARLDNGQQTAILQTGLGQAGHMSCRNYKRPGWCYLTRYDGFRGTARNADIVAVKLDGSQTVERFAHHFSSYVGYETEPQAVASPDGTKVIWKSDWDGTATVDVYVAGMTTSYVTPGGTLPPISQDPVTSPSSSVTVTMKNGLGKVATVVSGPLNVRPEPTFSFYILGTQPTGAKGVVIGGPVSAGGYSWWNIHYYSGVRGWSAGKYLMFN